jgi:hypothetical protein
MEFYFDQSTAISSPSFAEGTWADLPLEDLFISREPAVGSGAASLPLGGGEAPSGPTAANDDFDLFIEALLDQAAGAMQTNSGSTDAASILPDEGGMIPGVQSADGETVIVTYYYPGDSGGGGGGGGLNPPDPGDTSITPTEVPTPSPSQLYQDCDKDRKALEVAGRISQMDIRSVELGAGIYAKPDGSVGSGDIAIGEVDQYGDLHITIGFPPGVSILDTLGTVHSHPPRPTTGNADLDARVAVSGHVPVRGGLVELGAVGLQHGEGGWRPQSAEHLHH